MSSPLEPERLSPAVVTLIEKAQKAERSGQREIARRRYEAALYLLEPEEHAAGAAIIRRVARTYIDEGQFEAGLDCLTASLAASEASHDAGGLAHSYNMIAIVHGHRGNVDDVMTFAAEALTFAREANDKQLEAMIEQNLGVTSSMRGDFQAALVHYASCLVTFRAAGMRECLSQVLNNMGLVYTQLDKLDEAQAAYDEALTHCDATGDAAQRLLALINSVDLWLARGEIDRAEVLCRTVLYEAGEVNDQRALAETFRHLGVIARIRGNYDEAEHQLTAAFNDATRREDLLLAAETAREQAELYETTGKNTQMLKALSLSHRLFTKLRAEANVADLQRRIGRLERRFYHVVTNWAQTIESKDPYTLGHCERVADYACALARDIGFDEITMFWFRIGALLHDVGKIAVPSEVLNKPGKLTDEEREMMERHAAAGSDLLREIDFPWDVLPMVRGHHERWDGRGYPDKLAGEQIHLTARITCVADVFDALTTDRPYRAAFTRDQALAMMASDSGKLFDPELFPRFERVIRSTTLYRYPLPTTMPVAVAS